MTAKVIAVHPDTSTREIARLLLENHISAVPVLDGSGAPIGIVSEGDLIERAETERRDRRDWWLALLAEGGALSPEFMANLRQPGRTAREVMSRPVLTVTENTETAEIARMLQTYRIKRVPVVRDGQMVGIVSRANLLRALSGEVTAHAEVKPKPKFLEDMLADLDRRLGRRNRESERRSETPLSSDGLLSVADFRRLASDYESREAQHSEEMRRSTAEQRRRSVEQLIDQHLSDENWRNLVQQARVAAERGALEFMLLRFPSQLCSDSGRAINASEPDWPDTLRGEAAELYLHWARDLKPQGFRLAARVLDYPGGMPGDVGLFLAWKQ